MSDDRELAGRVALVTGSARNIGRAIAVALANGGASVMVSARQSSGDAEKVAAEIREAGGQSAVMLADVGEPSSAAGLVAATVTRFGRLDILVNNASVRREVDFADLDYREWREILATTLDGAYLCSHAARPHLIASDLGTIINIGGLSAHAGAARRAHVIAAKAGLVGLTRALAYDFAPHNVVVNCVAPGVIDTVRPGPAALDSALAREAGHYVRQLPPVGRKGSPEEIGALVRFICGPGARYITGQTIHINGGSYM